MPPYSRDLRKRVLETIQRGEGSVRQIASRFLVSVSFVTRLLRLHRTTGSVEPRPHGGGNPAVLGPEDLERLRELIRQQPDAMLEECRQRLGASCSTTGSPHYELLTTQGFLAIPGGPGGSPHAGLAPD